MEAVSQLVELELEEQELELEEEEQALEIDSLQAGFILCSQASPQPSPHP